MADFAHGTNSHCNLISQILTFQCIYVGYIYNVSISDRAGSHSSVLYESITGQWLIQ